MKIFAHAPGKVIITGEHFVVHGATALAAAISKGARVEVQETGETEIVSKTLRAKSGLDPPPSHPLRPVAEALRHVLERLGEKKGLRVLITSNIPSGSGLGSSSSVAVAVVAAAAATLGHQITKQEIVDSAMVAERLIHGNPSGIDVNIAAHGGVILFKRGQPPHPIPVSKPFSMIVAFSGIRRNTSRMIAKVTAVKQAHPHFFDGLAAASTRFSEIGAEALAKGDLRTLGASMTFHHTALSWLGASIPELDRMVETAQANGALGAKLTGGGGGGCIIALPTQEKAGEITTSLRPFARNVFVEKLPQAGIRVWHQT